MLDAAVPSVLTDLPLLPELLTVLCRHGLPLLLPKPEQKKENKGSSLFLLPNEGVCAQERSGFQPLWYRKEDGVEWSQQIARTILW